MPTYRWNNLSSEDQRKLFCETFGISADYAGLDKEFGIEFAKKQNIAPAKYPPLTLDLLFEAAVKAHIQFQIEWDGIRTRTIVGGISEPQFDAWSLNPIDCTAKALLRFKGVVIE